MSHLISLRRHGIDVGSIHRNLSPAQLYEHCVAYDAGQITSAGALATCSGERTGRSPSDKRIVCVAENRDQIWWGPVNSKLTRDSFRTNRRRAIDYLNSRSRLYVVDGFAGWDRRHRISIRVICSRPYHALFMHNMLIRPTEDELRDFGKPAYVIFNAGCFPADPDTPDLSSDTSIALDLEAGEFVILGTQYAGEMKKGVFSIMHYLMPERGVLSMHCSANIGPYGEVSLFFGLSGTGKTTLSADPRRRLIGDDEHCWSDEGIFNIEGGCYAKCIDLCAENEPEIYRAIRFGTVLENTVLDPESRIVDYADSSLTENTRASYPIDYIPNAQIPCTAGHPSNIIFLTCDAFGVLPPVSRLTPEQAMSHFVNGYTAKVAGTEMGVTEPEATFSACFGAAFLVHHPMVYAEMLAKKMRQHGANAWLVNTGWSGGACGTGERMKLPLTRAIVDAINTGELQDAETVEESAFGLSIPRQCPGVPDEMLDPRRTWSDKHAYDKKARELADLFAKNLATYDDYRR